jgi:hypothetical protein
MKDRIKAKDNLPEKADTGANIQSPAIKPKTADPIPEMEELKSFETEQEHERIAEKLSISVPTQPLQRPTGVLAYAGQRVRLLLRDGSVIIGFLQRRLWNYVHLLNIEETGRDFKLTSDWCDVEIGTIARVYPAAAKVEQISKP